MQQTSFRPMSENNFELIEAITTNDKAYNWHDFMVIWPELVFDKDMI